MTEPAADMTREIPPKVPSVAFEMVRLLFVYARNTVLAILAVAAVVGVGAGILYGSGRVAFQIALILGGPPQQPAETGDVFAGGFMALIALGFFLWATIAPIAALYQKAKANVAEKARRRT